MLIQTLAHQILGMREADGSRPRATPGIEDLGRATVNVEISGMVSSLRRQIWIDTSAYTQRIFDEIERQAGEVDLDVVIAKAVAREVSRTIADIERRVADEVKKLVSHRIAEKLKSFPDHLAQALAGKLWSEAWDARMADK